MWNIFALATLMAAHAAAQCPYPVIGKNGNAGLIVPNEIVPLGPATNPVKKIFNVGERIRFGCYNQNEILVTDSDEIECQRDGTWTGPAPKCLKVTSALDWKMFNNVEPELADEHFQCRPRSTPLKLWPPQNGFRLADLSQIKVELCGAVSGEFLVQIVAYRQDEIYSCEREKGRDAANKDFVYTCKFNSETDVESKFFYIAITPVQTEISLKKISILTQTGDSCGTPALPLNGFVELSNGQFRYKCDEGFVLDGSELATCTPKTGQWGSVPICMKIPTTSATTEPTEALRGKCDEPRDIANGKKQPMGNYLYRYQCDDGFLLAGKADVACNAKTGQWTEMPVCEKDDHVTANVTPDEVMEPKTTEETPMSTDIPQSDRQISSAALFNAQSSSVGMYLVWAVVLCYLSHLF